LPYWWFRPRNWVKPERRLYLAIGVYVEKGSNEPSFYVELGTNQKFGRELEMNPKFKRLCDDAGWKTHPNPAEWCYRTFKIGTGNIDKIARQQIRNLRAVKKEIRRLVKFVEKSL